MQPAPQEPSRARPIPKKPTDRATPLIRRRRKIKKRLSVSWSELDGAAGDISSRAVSASEPRADISPRVTWQPRSPARHPRPPRAQRVQPHSRSTGRHKGGPPVTARRAPLLGGGKGPRRAAARVSASLNNKILALA